MLSRSRTCLALAALAALGVTPSRGADFKRVPFSTVDGVELEGTYYYNQTGKRDAVVLLLHNFEHKKGGGSHQDGWDSLADALVKDGYSVFTFDFRGFGNSKTVNPERFWRFQHNQRYIMGANRAKPPETIDEKNFSQAYFPYLINDIAAAKAFLDRKNDSREVNTSNLVIIGAGNGATLGALWLWTQCRLQRDRASVVLGVPPALDPPEGKDVAAAIWLSINNQPPGGVFPLRSAVVEAGRDAKIPTAFLYGKRDNRASNFSRGLAEAITGPRSKGAQVLTGAEGFDTQLAGSKLLDSALPTEAWIIEKYLNPVIEKRGSHERKTRDVDRYAFYWSRTKPNDRAGAMPGILAKRPGEEMIHVIPPDLFNLANGQ
jgi:pimeloyl-ACP methyl ester carboxylesterase